MLALLRRRAVACAVSVAASTCALPFALAQETPPANTLMDMRRQFGECMAGKSLGPAGSQLTIMFMMKRDGSIFGKPRVTFSHLEGDEEARKRFVDDAERAITACLPFRVTPALGGAIAGRLFSVTLGGPKPEKAI
jgi:hypothetical protein